MIVTGEIALATLIDNFIIFFFYNGPSPPPGVFDKFDAIPSQIDSTTTQSYAELVSQTVLLVILFIKNGLTLAAKCQWHNKSLRPPLSHPRIYPSPLFS